MPDTKYQTQTRRTDIKGVDLAHPVDEVQDGKCPILSNVRNYGGSITNRPGLTDIDAVVTSKTPVHSARRLNDPRNSTWTRIVGADDRLAYGQTTFTDADGTYSGDPLALVPWYNSYSPDPWMYVADSLRMRKIQADGTIHHIGLAAPDGAPTLALSAPSYKAVSEFEDATDWTQGGDAAAPSDQVRVNTTVAQIIYDTGSTGWACVNPTSFDQIGEGARLTFDVGGGDEEIATVQEVHPGATATTIAAVSYDSGSSGLCSVVLTIPSPEAETNGLIRNTTQTENARILSVHEGPEGTTSIRVSTSNTWAATDSVQILPSFRIYLTNTHAAAEDIDRAFVRTAITYSTGLATLDDTIALDLSSIASGLATQPDDYIHISLRVSRPDLVEELKFQFDVDASTNDFTQNFYTYSVRPSDLTPSVRNAEPQLTTRTTIATNDIVDQVPLKEERQAGRARLRSEYLGPPLVQGDMFEPAKRGQAGIRGVPGTSRARVVLSEKPDQLAPGDTQWIEIFFRPADMTRVGTDYSRTLKDVAKTRVAALVTGDVTLDVDSWWVGGGYGPDSGSATAIPYTYRFRARHPDTNVASNFSQAVRGGVAARRQQIVVSPTQYSLPSGMSGAATDFVLDVERFGGEIAEWRYVGTVANSATPSFTDDLSDIVIAGNPSEGNTNYQPWPITDVPQTATAGTVVGTTVNDSGTSFDTSWAPGTRILINDLPYTIYRVRSTSKLELVENAGSQTSVTWRIPEPVLLGQPLPCLWECDDHLVACGDDTNPGRFYYTHRLSETTRIENWEDVTNPSEPLMNGTQWNERCFMWSSEQQFQLLHTGDPERPFRHEQIPGGRGLFARWALTRFNQKAPFMAFLSKDGIYRSEGGVAESLTDRDLYPLFPHEGQLGSDTNGFVAPNIVSAQAANLRLEFSDDVLYFDYVDTSADRQTLIYIPDLDGWWADSYTPGVVFHYGEEGDGVHAILAGGADATTAHLYQLTGNDDGGTAIACQVRFPSLHQGYPRENKRYGDVMVDLDPASVTVTLTPGTNQHSTTYTATTSAAASRTQVAATLGTAWQTARDISLDAAWSVNSSSHPVLYIWEPRWTLEPAAVSAFAWETSTATTFGMPNFKHFGLYRITHVSTVDLTLTVTVDGVAQTGITIANGSGAYTTTVGRFPVYKGKLFHVRLSSTTEFRLDGRDTYIQVKEWGSPNAYQPLKVFSDYSLVEG